jgi:translation initiation factor IF-1
MQAGFFEPACFCLAVPSQEWQMHSPSPHKADGELFKRTFTPVRSASKDTMPTESSIVVEGKITAVLPGTMFRVELSNKHLVLAHISGKMRKRFIRLTVGDRVKMEMSPYDVTKARIVYRL